MDPVTNAVIKLLLLDDFLGASSSSSQLTYTPPLNNSSTQGATTLAASTSATPLSPVLSPNEERNSTLSVSSDSVSMPTQIEMRPEPAATELTKKLTEASLEDVADKTQGEPRSGKTPQNAQVEAVSQQEATVHEVSVRSPVCKAEAAKEEGPQDLRVFELNSDSGKSTPSNNGKKGTVTWDIFGWQ